MPKNYRYDSWKNNTTGLNTLRDKSTLAIFEPSARLDDQTLNNLYHDDDISAALCNGMPEYAMRRGFEVNVQPETEERNDQDVIQENMQLESDVMDFISDIELFEKLTEAQVWGNVFGGAAIILGINDGNQDYSQPLNEDNIVEFTHMNVIDRRFLTPISWYEDPKEKKFGKPKTYLLTPFAMSPSTDLGSLVGNSAIFEIHETRMEIIGGVLTSISRRQEYNGWEDSLLNRVHKVLRQFGASWDTLAHLIEDANQAVFKMDSYIDALAADDAGVIQQRIALMDTSRSAIRALVLDAENEDFERANFNWSGIKEPFELFQQRFSLATGYPITVLMGRSPAGQNATGESDWENFDSKVEAYQEFKIKKHANRLVSLVLKAQNGPSSGAEPENWAIVFPPLRSLTPTQDAEIKNKTANTDKTYIDAGVLEPEEVAVNRFGPDGYSTETSIDTSIRTMPTEESLDEDPSEFNTDPSMPGLDNSDDGKSAGLDVSKTETVKASKV